MRINNMEVLDLDQVFQIFPNMRPVKRALCGEIFAEGRLFVANNNRNMELAQHWQEYDPQLVTNVKKTSPHFLWSIRVEKC